MLINKIINYLKCIRLNILELLGLVDSAESPFNHGPFYQSCFPVPIDPQQLSTVAPIVCQIPLGSNIVSVTLLTYINGSAFCNESIELINITTQTNPENLLVLANISGYSVSHQFYVCIIYMTPSIESQDLNYNNEPLLYNGQPFIFTNL